MRQGVVGIALAAGLLVTAGLRMLRKSTAAPSAKHRIYVLKNNKGVEVHITPLGAIIVRLLVPDRNGKLDDIVLGYEEPSSYLQKNNPYFGAIVGRCANRIANAKFSLGGEEYLLAANNGANSLHGGKVGFNKRVFDATEEETASGRALVLRYTSPDREEGYPGTVEVTVRYELLADINELRTTITATSDQATPVNIAQHSYFNLAGHDSGSILDHVARLNADHFTPVNVALIPTGEIQPVRGTPFDFTEPHAIGERIAQVAGGYDHNYVLHSMGPQARFIVKNGMASATPRTAAEVVDPKSGRKLEVLTTAPGVQFYTGNFLDGSLKGTKGGARYAKHAGFCLETQGFPDSINQAGFPSVVLQPGQEYRHELVYRLSNVEQQ